MTSETDGPAVEVHYQPGVMDPVALSTTAAIRELLVAAGLSQRARIDEVRTAQRYTLDGVADLAELEDLLRRELQEYLYGETKRRPVVIPVLI